jgi:predicted ATPase/class 3 adenylate cyclase/Tfp pilus assembly protein PilF
MADPSPIPAGTVTFLLTDIEGSAGLWERDPRAMGPALARHDALLNAAIDRHGGTVVKSRGEGDSLFAVFQRATEAVAAAADIQESLGAESWPTSAPIRVRLALYTGEAELRDGDYYGAAVNRCARLRDAAHGGQVLLSETTQSLVSDGLPARLGLKDLGSHRLRGLKRPARVWQLVHSSLPADFPSLRTLDNLPNNLPRQLTSFVGRTKEIAEVKRLLGVTALLTLVGSGGCGKTRLALQAGADLLQEYADGVWLVELAPLSDPMLVPQAVATALGVKEEAERALLQTLIEYLRPRRLLLLLDNSEHLLAACASLAEALLRACPQLRMLATSREGLGIAGETTYRVPSLSSPHPNDAASPESLSQYEAVRLFIDRATAVQPGFSVTNRNAPALAQLCYRLDGIPLAIELAAARVRAIPVEQIASRLDDRFRLLTGGSRTALPRQQTLRALVDWSYDLLADPERALLMRLSMFAGGWTLEAAERVCAGGVVEEWEVLDILTSLVDKSLVLYDGMVPDARYHLTETVRQYAREKVIGESQSHTFHQQHRDYFLSLAEEAREELLGREQGEWLQRLETEHDNMRVAFEFCAGDPDSGGLGLRLSGSLWKFWEIRGFYVEGRERCRIVLAHPGAQALGRDRAAALNAAGWLAYRQNDYVAARKLLEESVQISRGLNDAAALGGSLRGLGVVVADLHDFGLSRELLEEAVRLCRELGDRRGEAMSLNNLGAVIEIQGDHEAARSYYERARGLIAAVDDRTGLAITLGNLGRIACRQGDLPQARAFLTEALVLDRALRDRRLVASDLQALAGVEVAEAQHERAAWLLGAGAALCEQIGAPPHPLEQESINGYLAILGEALPDEDLATALAAGRAMGWEQAVAYALGET